MLYGAKNRRSTVTNPKLTPNPKLTQPKQIPRCTGNANGLIVFVAINSQIAQSYGAMSKITEQTLCN